MKQTENNIILVGMPFSGKTTIGKLLSKKMNFKFVDLDILIEKNQNMKISEIFSKFGEDYFRELETKTLSEFNEKTPFVLSTGGGTMKKEKNIQILKKMGIIFYLEIEPELLYERIKDDKTRPLLQNQNPKKTLIDLYEARKDNYKKADFKVSAENKPEITANEIINEYENFKCKNEKQ